MNKTAALRIRLDPVLHQDFLRTCQALDRPAAQVLREFMREYVDTHRNKIQADLFERSH